MSFTVVIPWRTDGGSRQRIHDWVFERWSLVYPTTAIIVADSGDETFSRGASRNVGVEQSSTSVVVLADSDTVPIKAFVDAAVATAERGTMCFAYDKKRYYNLAEGPTERYLNLSPMTEVTKPLPGEYEHELTSWAGMIAVPRANFDQIGGYDERFVGWGHEDLAFQIKMDAECGPHERVNGGYVVHLWHPRGDATFDTTHELQNRALFKQEYQQKYGWRDPRV